MSLTLVIPSHDDRLPLLRALGRAAEIGMAERIVVVDDGSTTPLEAGELCRAADLPSDRLTLLRNDRPLGPGAARNRGLRAVKTEHLLFLDADDLPTGEIASLMGDLTRAGPFDFCIFQHHDSRMAQERLWGQSHHDHRFWRLAGVDLGALSPVPTTAAQHLARTANYPWNKIYRTGFLRDHGIGCSEILVHEDVELHWRGFLNAGRILASDRIGVVHFVSSGGDRLTNRDGPERLAVFGPFARLAEEIAGQAEGPTDSPYAYPFFRFALGLCDWISAHLRAEFRPALADHIETFLAEAVPPAFQDRIAAEEPTLMSRLAALKTPE